MYLHILDREKFAGMTLPGVQGTVVSCTTYDGAPCGFVQEENGISITLPKNLEPQVDTIVKITLDTELV